MTRTNTIRRTLTLTLGAALGILSLSTSAFAAPSEKSRARGNDPSGNNGTIKIDGSPFDEAPDNEPHVGCTFQIDFYGFDRGSTYFSEVSFEGIAPTGGGALVPTKGSTSVFVGEDAAGGGTDLDGSELYDLTNALSAVEPHPQQGYHVKVTVHTPFSRGADVKHKVLWITPCAPPAPEEQPKEEVKEEPKQEPKQEIRTETKTETKEDVASTVVTRVEQLQPAPVVVPEVAAAAVAATEATSSMVLSAAAESAPATPVAGPRATVLGVEYTRGAAEELAVTGTSVRTLLLLAGIALCLGMSFVSGSKLLTRA